MNKIIIESEETDLSERYLYSRLIPHLEIIESEHKRGKSYKKIAKQFDLTPKKFYRALQRAKAAIEKDPSIKEAFEYQSREVEHQLNKSSLEDEQVNSKQRMLNTQEVNPNIKNIKSGQIRTKAEAKKPFNKAELMKKIKPSAFKHRFNIDLKHT